MNWVDVVVLLLAVMAAVSGAFQGVIVALPALVGVALGAVAGVKLAPFVISLFDSPVAKVAFAFAVVVFLIVLGETLGVWVGRKLRQKINPDKLSGIDKTLGAILQAAAVFVVAWLVANPLTTVSAIPGLAKSINSSVVLGKVNDLMPAEAQGLPSDLRKLLDASGFPSALSPFEKAPSADTPPPDTSLNVSAVAKRVHPSVVKIRGNAPSCSRALEGSGFVVAPQRVMTNAHVVAGTDEVGIESTSGDYRARVVYFNPEIDVAVLAVPGLRAPVLPFAPETAKAGDNAVVLGYPLDGPYTATPARVRGRINLRGPDIYDANTVQRDVFTVRGTVRSGNSGGPMITPDGDVIGVVFGAAVEDPDTGFTLTADQVRSAVDAAPSQTARVGTGACAN
ncbi:MarP family serine protease [Amycolatopsis rubida]|uniref:Colicin V production protein n=1 Tax=Amycolatopsis rubida TaxID=112413 RepID=A0A1I5G702_9PSEU|nr:MarP family serine protease [Amycolatopsis rubida]MYW94621.1 MarP family serine protease [Amycolatopsis rubida]NEC59609.1 MarP family serine protease [Amycolatopsis rubida]SFO31800.1 Colicin V production protein [Amycolatopsis rubida]